MKLSLVVKKPRKLAGREIPVTSPVFAIGTDARCQLRLKSTLVGAHHCALLVRGTKVFVQELDTNNKVLINGKDMKGGFELRNADRLQIGPVEFAVSIDVGLPEDPPTLFEPEGVPGTVELELPP